MAKAKAANSADPVMKHARIELEEPDYERMKQVAKLNGLSISAYIRQAVLQRIRQDEISVGGPQR